MSFRLLWKKFTQLFKRKKPAPQPSPSAPPQVSTNGKIKRVGLVVGHNKDQQGAVNYRGESEYSFYSRIAPKLQDSLANAGVETVIVYRGTGSYSRQCRKVARELSKQYCDMAVCMHFNSYNGSTQGIESLVYREQSNYAQSYNLGKTISRVLQAQYKWSLRGTKGVKTLNSGDRGAQMLASIAGQNIIATLIEPCFGDNRSSSLLFDDEAKFVKALRNAIVEVV